MAGKLRVVDTFNPADAPPQASQQQQQRQKQRKKGAGGAPPAGRVPRAAEWPPGAQSAGADGALVVVQPPTAAPSLPMAATSPDPPEHPGPPPNGGMAPAINSHQENAQWQFHMATYHHQAVLHHFALMNHHYEVCCASRMATNEGPPPPLPPLPAGWTPPQQETGGGWPCAGNGANYGMDPLTAEEQAFIDEQLDAMQSMQTALQNDRKEIAGAAPDTEQGRAQPDEDAEAPVPVLHCEGDDPTEEEMANFLSEVEMVEAWHAPITSMCVSTPAEKGKAAASPASPAPAPASQPAEAAASPGPASSPAPPRRRWQPAGSPGASARRSERSGSPLAGGLQAA
eukprot:TRINITY_DN60061_c0_g1_i1.p1 TRINITY_DN60061_c0_g1~~TRINITY_DN60061_c0_g1_i1.p1  ORF type:complete len:367 (+),score=69.45 TRINITY_DN60061_c0_g1_i1:76-1101(+)